MTSVLHNCLFVNLLTFLLFRIICILTCLPYFLQCFCALLNCFLSANYSHLHFLLFCRLLPVLLPRFEWLLVHAFSFLLLSQIAFCFYSAACFLFCLVVAFPDVCLARFVLAFFALQISGAKQICACSFSFFLALLFGFFYPSLRVLIHIAPRASSFPSIPPYGPL